MKLNKKNSGRECALEVPTAWKNEEPFSIGIFPKSVRDPLLAFRMRYFRIQREFAPKRGLVLERFVPEWKPKGVLC
jgi:hypothetical protein